MVSDNLFDILLEKFKVVKSYYNRSPYKDVRNPESLRVLVTTQI